MKDSLLKIKGAIEKNELLTDILYVFLGFLVMYAFYTGIGFALGTPNPVVTVVSGSMLPTLERGDILVLKGISSEDELEYGREKGTILIYYHPNMNKLIVHRLYQKNPDGTYKTWGDNNPMADPWSVEHEWFRGRMILRIPYLGYPKILLSEFLRGGR
ncbi:MAG: signal peptidase I [Candidatus Aenigmarchaeota archaeon]|nr:signal peptidase I [Candidatus Aenigmarchaeota archaeon]